MIKSEIMKKFAEEISQWDLKIPDSATFEMDGDDISWEIEPDFLVQAFNITGLGSMNGRAEGRRVERATIDIIRVAWDSVCLTLTADYHDEHGPAALRSASDTFVWREAKNGGMGICGFGTTHAITVWEKYQELYNGLGNDPSLLDVLGI